jgi:hypothetical protein
VLFFEAIPMSRLLGTIAANFHTAPSARVPTRVVRKQERASRSLARFDMREVFLGQKDRQHFADRLKQ